MRTLFSLLLIFLFIETSFAQVEKFGKIDAKTLKMQIYPQDSTADAVILFDQGKSFFKTESGGSLKLVYERHIRIKIFNTSAYDWANVKIPYYDAGASKEDVRNIKGVTYQLVNGKVEKSKLKDDAIFTEKRKQHWHIKKFTMPSVKEGCVIEYKYTINSDFFQNLREWYFQSSIPIIYSEYKVKIPEYFRYQFLSQLYEVVEVNTKQYVEDFNFVYSSSFKPGMTGGRTSGGTQTVSTKISEHKWKAKHIRAFKNERFITSPQDCLSKIEFLLTHVKPPNSPVEENVSATWDKVVKYLRESESFGKQLNKKHLVKDLASSFIAKYENKLERLQAIYEYVKTNFRWNGNYGVFASKNLKQFMDSKKGNIAQLNLMLTLLLKNAEIQANPVIISTRPNGKVNNLYPSLDKFNYVITFVKVDNQEFLLDASSPFSAIGHLPFRCLNDKGLLIGALGFDWVALKSNARGEKKIAAMFKMEGDKINGEINVKHLGYYATGVRNYISKIGKEKYIKDIWQNETKDYEVLEDIKITNLEKLDKAITEKVKVKLNTELLGDRIYLSPILVNFYDENPLKLEERKYPVDFGYPFKESYMFSIEVGEDYEVEELPKNNRFILPDKSGYFDYSVSLMNNYLQLRTVLGINKPVFTPQEYNNIKEMFLQVISKQEEQIVLKKK